MTLPDARGVRHRWVDLPTGVRMHVAEAGPDDGPPVLCLHGWPQHWYAWREVMPALADDGYRVLAPDMRGFGWSDAPRDGDFRKERLADDALALLDAEGIERVGLIGHDWGAWTGFLLCAREPERVSAFLALAIARPWQPAMRWLANAPRLAYQWPLAAPILGPALVRRGGYVEAMLRGGAGPGFRWDPGVLRSFVERQGPAASSALYRHIYTRELRDRIGDRAPELPMPVELLVGSHEKVLDGALVSDAEMVPGAGHFLVDERPALVIERARAILTACA
jgi:pimeloyl-ACP methyl ester carboxylesterase